MAIAEDIYERCKRCLRDAAALTKSLQDGKAVTPADVSARRAAADIAADTVFCLLRQAFITPIDREDLWALRDSCEAVLRAAEDTALVLYCAGRGVPPCCAPVLEQAARACAVPLKLWERFPHIASGNALSPLREAERVCYETKRAVFADATARRVCEAAVKTVAACERAVGQLQYRALKNT
ncbi:MAG: hypothetical protein IJP14_02425 [Clostridia bacterium]|nr:hypothetical protein [Clostridia bacterium]